ncbi:MAG TPA: tetratricopeptide repeat protein [Thermoanaerobaculia bacterium]|nr:tetratricopeptide repeat protein [Thermoanaerobaculia bacterium]
MSYSVREVSAMLGLSAAQIRAYANKGFLEPERGPRGELRFGFHDLVILRTAGELAAAKVPQRKVQRVLQRLREQLPKGQSLTGVRISADGDRVVVREGGALWNAESGQTLLDFSVDDLAEKTAAIDNARSPEVDDMYELACEIESSSPEQAREVYQRLLQLQPDHVDALVNCGRLLHEGGAPAAAEQHYRKALEIDPEHETAAFNLGVALEDLGRFRDAIDAYGRALELDPQNADAHFNLAGLYERRGEKPAALRHLKMYRRLTMNR